MTSTRGLNQGLLYGILDSPNLTSEFLRFASSHTSSNNRTSDIASTTECSLGGEEDVRNILAVNASERFNHKVIKIAYLVFAEDREMHEDFDRFSVSGEDDKFRDTAVERFRC